jgi:hypothetical protein
MSPVIAVFAFAFGVLFGAAIGVYYGATDKYTRGEDDNMNNIYAQRIDARDLIGKYIYWCECPYRVEKPYLGYSRYCKLKNELVNNEICARCKSDEAINNGL